MIDFRKFALSPIAAIALLLAARAVAGAPSSPLEGGYSIAFPAQPTEQKTSQLQSRSTLYALLHNGTLYMSGYTQYDFNVAVDGELQADVDNFAKPLEATVTARERTEFTAAGGRRMPALDFSYEGPQIAGQGRVILTGPRTVVMVVAGSVKPADRKAEVDAFLKSLAISETP
jgi:hypothetical protein